ncbi:MAG TPA: hypothetical protein PLB18_20320 [Acidobacteriota bacterium]|nr:hypothetical protein [Acidobacteriota bacterium]
MSQHTIQDTDPPPFTFTIPQTGSYTTASGTVTCNYPGYIVSTIKVYMNDALVGNIPPDQTEPLDYSGETLPVTVEIQVKLKPIAPPGTTVEYSDEEDPGPEPGQLLNTVSIKKKVPNLPPVTDLLYCLSTLT